jgi:hypothetical protein
MLWVMMDSWITALKQDLDFASVVANLTEMLDGSTMRFKEPEYPSDVGTEVALSLCTG